MKPLIVDVRAPDGRVFELLVRFGDLITIDASEAESSPPVQVYDLKRRTERAAVLDATCIEVTSGGREQRSTTEVLALVGREPDTPEARV